MIRALIFSNCLAMAFFMGSANVLAQHATWSEVVEESASDDPNERVIVLSHPISITITESTVPVTIYTESALRKAGANTLAEGLRGLPSAVGRATTENDSNGGNGQAGLNLRGLGQRNTLVLINGRRAFLGQGLNTSADVNAIPLAALSRVEVLKDGAGPNYGSDAVGGAANFIMLNGPGEEPYKGAEVNLLYGNTTDGDAHVRLATIRGGVVGVKGKVAIAAAAEYYSRASLFSRDRAISLTSDLSSSPGDPFYPDSAGLGLGGFNRNSAVFAGRVSVMDAGQGGPTGDLVLVRPESNQVTPASYRPFHAGSDPSAFNIYADTPAIPAVEQAMHYVTGRYKIFGDRMQLYGDMLFAKTKQDNARSPSAFRLQGTERASNGLAVSDSIFNPFGNNLESVSYRLVNEAGLRRSFYDHDYSRYTVGLNGDFKIPESALASFFGYDAGFVYERFDEVRTDSGDATRRAMLDQSAADLFNPFIGQSASIIGFAPTYLNGVPTGMTAPYNNLLGFQNAAYRGRSFFHERDCLFDVRAFGNLFPKLETGGVGFSVGYEHRSASASSIPDPVLISGDQWASPNHRPRRRDRKSIRSSASCRCRS